MANTSGRMLQLLSLLQTHRFWPGAELAERLEVSPRTLRRDVERLRDLGYPVAASRGVTGGYQLRSGAAMPPLLLDDEEAVAIAVGMRTAASGALEGIDETSVRALSKILQIMPPRLRRRVEALRAYTLPPTAPAGPTVDAMALTVIAQACRDDERLRFEYLARDGQQTTRLVEPHRLVPQGRRWYLVAWDAERHGWRTFRVDRLADPKPTGARFRQRELPAADAAAFVRAQLAAIPSKYEVDVVVSAPSDAVEHVVGQWGTVEPIGDRSCRLRMNMDTLDWAALILCSVGAEFEVTAPAELQEYLQRTGELFLRCAR